MVVEFLTFTVPVDDRDHWLLTEERHWSRFLEGQDGFVRKEMWVAADDPTVVHAVIWWESTAHWKAVPQPALDAVAAAMGPHERTATCTAFDVVRTT